MNQQFNLFSHKYCTQKFIEILFTTVKKLGIIHIIQWVNDY